MAYKCKVERGSAEEEKINSILNNTVRNTYFLLQKLSSEMALG